MMNNKMAGIARMLQTSQRNMSVGVYMWAKMPRIGTKSGSLKNQLEMPKGTPKRVEEFDKLNVKKLRIGLRHSAVITEEGDLYTFGTGNWGVLGHGNEDQIRFNKPKLVEGLKKADVKVKDVQLGEYHTLVLAEDGSVWTWGYGGKKGFFNWMYTQEVGALGHGTLDPFFSPKKVQYFSDHKIKVSSIASGNYHCVAVTDDGSLYNWGRGLYGVLGNGSNQQSLVPVLNEEFVYQKEQAESFQKGTFGFKKIQAADDYTGALLKDGSFWVWGKNDRGQMGVGSGIGIDLVESENMPKEIDFKQALPVDQQKEPVIITDFTAGMNTMVFRDSKNNIYKTGLKIDYVPKLCKFDQALLPGDKIQSMQCGRQHYVILDSDNNLHTIGTVFKDKTEKTHDGFMVNDGDVLFDNGKIIQMSMQYEIYGAIVKH